MQVGLVQAEGGDEAAQKARADALLARYQALSAEREAQAKAPDARFSRYKSEEKRIVDEVMALDSIPDGLSRDQYLRQRLQEAREQAYRKARPLPRRRPPLTTTGRGCSTAG